jgi:hypothetical protein
LEISMPTVSPRRRAVVGGGLAAAAAALLGSAASSYAQAPRNYATLAMVGEPQTLDPMASTADLVGTIMQHVYETLYTFDAKWNVGADAGRSAAQGLGRRQDLLDHAAQGRDAAQRPRAERRRRGREPAALDGAVAARQGGRPRSSSSIKAKGPLASRSC